MVYVCINLNDRFTHHLDGYSLGVSCFIGGRNHWAALVLEWQAQKRDFSVEKGLGVLTLLCLGQVW